MTKPDRLSTRRALPRIEVLEERNLLSGDLLVDVAGTLRHRA